MKKKLIDADNEIIDIKAKKISSLKFPRTNEARRFPNI
jgi:hypothetical protein